MEHHSCFAVFAETDEFQATLAYFLSLGSNTITHQWRKRATRRPRHFSFQRESL